MIRWTLPGGARRAALATALVAATLAVPVTAQLRDETDLDAIYRIKQEGASNSKVMETLSYLTDVNGPRLTNSPMMHQAAEWAQKQLTAWGLANVHTEKWGPFGRGWVNEHTSIRMDAPQPFVLLGYPKAWTPGTTGEVSGDAVAVTIETDEDLAKYKGTLKGKFVLQSPTREVASYFESPTRRYTDVGSRRVVERPDRRPSWTLPGRARFRSRDGVPEEAHGLLQGGRRPRGCRDVARRAW